MAQIVHIQCDKAHEWQNILVFIFSKMLDYPVKERQVCAEKKGAIISARSFPFYIIDIAGSVE